MTRSAVFAVVTRSAAFAVVTRSPAFAVATCSTGAAAALRVEIQSEELVEERGLVLLQEVFSRRTW